VGDGGCGWPVKWWKRAGEVGAKQNGTCTVGEGFAREMEGGKVGFGAKFFLVLYGYLANLMLVNMG